MLGNSSIRRLAGVFKPLGSPANLTLSRFAYASGTLARRTFASAAEDSKFNIKGEFQDGRSIYLDSQATTIVDPRVLDAMLPFFTEQFGNPHSRTHHYGWETEKAVETARKVPVIERSTNCPQTQKYSIPITSRTHTTLLAIDIGAPDVPLFMECKLAYTHSKWLISLEPVPAR